MSETVLLRCSKILVLIFYILLPISATTNSNEDFMLKNVLPDGEIEVRIHYHGISAKETTVSSRSSTNIILRQLTDGKHFIQLIYDHSDNIKDCEYLHERGQTQSFLKMFQSDLESIVATSNVTIESLDNKHLPKHIRKWFNYGKLRKNCRKSHKAIKKALQSSRKLKREEESNARSRNPRSITDYLIAPGTYWCGYDDVAKSYTALGGMSYTDKCCRKHDHCKNNIHGFSKKYNYYNLKPFTISHCWCDSSFRACLKMAGTSDANLVGKLFFNVVQTKCFVLKPRKMCVRRSWWGKCTKKKYIKQAVLRDNLSY